MNFGGSSFIKLKQPIQHCCIFWHFQMFRTRVLLWFGLLPNRVCLFSWLSPWYQMERDRFISITRFVFTGFHGCIDRFHGSWGMSDNCFLFFLFRLNLVDYYFCFSCLGPVVRSMQRIHTHGIIFIHTFLYFRLRPTSRWIYFIICAHLYFT